MTVPRGRAAPPEGRALLAESPAADAAEICFPASHRNGPASAKPGVGTAGRHESRPTLERQGRRDEAHAATGGTVYGAGSSPKASRRRILWMPPPCWKT